MPAACKKARQMPMRSLGCHLYRCPTSSAQLSPRRAGHRGRVRAASDQAQWPAEGKHRQATLSPGREKARYTALPTCFHAALTPDTSASCAGSPQRQSNLQTIEPSNPWGLMWRSQGLVTAWWVKLLLQCPNHFWECRFAHQLLILPLPLSRARQQQTTFALRSLPPV